MTDSAVKQNGVNDTANKIQGNTFVRHLEFMWEIPFALVSFIAFKLYKAVVVWFYHFYMVNIKKESNQWTVLDGELIDKVLTVPALLANAPRWNTHVIAAKTGGFAVNQRLAIHYDAAQRSTKPWTAVIYKFPKTDTVGYVDALGADTKLNWTLENGWAEVQLPAGNYALGLRYYEVQQAPVLPEVRADGVTVIEEKSITPQNNDFFHRLIEKENLLYKLLHFYIYVILRYRRFLPEKFIYQEYLPVGNPDTHFIYGALLPGNRLRFTIAPEIFDYYNVYYDYYDYASFPVYWGRVNEPSFVLDTATAKGYYLVRVVPREKCPEPFQFSQVKVDVV